MLDVEVISPDQLPQNVGRALVVVAQYESLPPPVVEDLIERSRNEGVVVFLPAEPDCGHANSLSTTDRSPPVHLDLLRRMLR